MSTWLRTLIVFTLPVVLSFGVGWAAEQPGGAAAFAPCADCHDTLAAQFLTNPHSSGTATVSGKAICESCHGDGTRHAEEGGDKALITVPKGGAGAKQCLACHQGRDTFDHTAVGFHASASVNCADCHSVHAASAPRLLKAPSTTLCVSCHAGQKVQFSKPYTHRVGRSGIECASCHNPHGGPGVDQSLKKTAAGELPCLSCHPQMQGPFVFTHVTGMAGDCMSCHEPHGSNNSKMLTRARVDQLCLECHTTLPAGTLGSQPPSFHDLRSPRYTNCTVCHVAVHGSNSSPMLLR